MDPLDRIRNGFAHGRCAHSHFYAVCSTRHESSMIPKALKIATLEKKMAPIPRYLPIPTSKLLWQTVWGEYV